MVRRKGIGYIIEAFVSSLVVMIFVFSSFNTISAPEKDWGEFRTRVSAEDATYSLHKSGQLEHMISNGDPESVSALQSSMSSTEIEISGSINGPPNGKYRIGIFTEESQMTTFDLKEIKSSDRCYDDLEEINSEFNILRTTSSSVMENQYDTRIYFADADPQNFGKYNGNPDYDTYYVDIGQECQFSASEGPFKMDSYVTFGDSNKKTFQVKNVSEGKKTVLMYRSDLAREIREKINRYPSAKFEIDNFNFSDSFRSNDVLVFNSNSTLDEIESNQAAMNDYIQKNPVLLSMDLNKTQIRTGFISDTGMSYVNLSLTFSSDRNPSFSDNTASKRLESYMKSIGYNLSSFTLNPSKVSSKDDGTVEKGRLVESANFEYETSKWDYDNSSMEDTSEPDINAAPSSVTESSCSSPHRSGIFEFPTENGYRKVTGYSTKLDGSSSNCQVHGVSIDENNNGEIENDEKIFLDGERTDIIGRTYEVRILDHKHVRFVYVGDRKLEYFNYRQEFENSEVSKIGRIPEINSGSSDAEIALLSSSTLFLLEGENSFGPSPATGVSAITSVPTDNGIYRVGSRWGR